MKKTKLAVLFLMVCMLVMISAFGVGAKAKYILRYAGCLAPDDPGTKGQYTIAEEVKKATNGEVEIVVYPANQLGDYTQIYEDVMRGNIDMGNLYITGQYNPMLEICSLPYLTTSWEDLKRVFRPGSFWYKTYEEAHAKVGIKLLGVDVDSFNLYTSMQTGICDGWVGGTATLNYLQFRDLIKHFYPIRIFVQNVSDFINRDVFEKLPEEYQKILIDACQKQSMLSIVNAEKREAYYRKKLRDEYGVKIHEVSQAQIDALAAQVREVSWPKFAKIFGSDIIEGILSDIK